MTSTDHALLQAVLAAPHLDAPRLVMADWLEEHAGHEACNCIGTRPLVQTNPHIFGKCTRCGGTGRASDGRAERAEFIRATGDEVWRAFCGVYNSLRDELASLTGFRFCGFGREDDDRGRPYLRFAWRDESTGEHNVFFHFRRGFVAALALPLASFTEGTVKAIFSHHPVEEVRFSNKYPEPHTMTGGTNYDSFSWFCDGLQDDPATLPEDLFSCLTGGYRTEPAFRRIYTAEADAIAALSRAAVRLGRRRAGLDCGTD